MLTPDISIHLYFKASEGKRSMFSEYCNQLTNSPSIPDLSGVVPYSVRAELDSPGRPLDRQVRSQMEAAFGAEFSDVRVHSGSTAASSARAINAVAYAHRNHIVFGAGAYAPHSEPGRRIRAHELAQDRKSVV